MLNSKGWNVYPFRVNYDNYDEGQGELVEESFMGF